MNTQSTVTARSVPPEVTAWFRNAAIPITGTNPATESDDFLPLEHVIGDARIVAMGEATHGTHEFFQLKHRMLEFLVERMDFTVFAIEANWPESLVVNDYVLNGKGDPEQALGGLYFWTWDTQEVLQMIEWIRSYNRDPRHRRKVQFLGFDMQVTQVAVSNVIAYLEEVDPNEAKVGREILAPLQDQMVEREYPEKPAEFRKKTAQGIESMLSSFDQRKAAYVKTSSNKEWELARHNLEIVSQAEEMLAHGSPSARDRAMAANVKWILDHEPPDTKIMLWAHNLHVASLPGGDASMGSSLRKVYGQQMVVCGFAFDYGSFQAIGPHQSLRTFSVAPAGPNTFDAALAQTGIPIFAIDLRAAPSDGVVGDWLNTPQRMREIGAVYDEKTYDAYFQAGYPHEYDVVFFVDKTTAALRNTKPFEYSPREVF